ncbi:MAG: hypothetical protein ACRDHP_17700, partial [Ktedonobacterales bacterium]
SPARYTSMIYPDITGYRAASLDMGQALNLLQDVLKQAKLADTPIKTFGWEWTDMTIGQVVEKCQVAQDVLFSAVEVTIRVEQGIEQAYDMSDAAGVLRESAAEYGNEHEASVQLRKASHYEQIAGTLRLIASRKSAIPRIQVTRARATLREAERMKSAAKKREGG